MQRIIVVFVVAFLAALVVLSGQDEAAPARTVPPVQPSGEIGSTVVPFGPVTPAETRKPAPVETPGPVPVEPPAATTVPVPTPPAPRVDPVPQSAPAPVVQSPVVPVASVQLDNGCAPGWHLAEDLSCVNPGFYALSDGLITAEDGTSVSPDYYNPPPGEPAPVDFELLPEPVEVEADASVPTESASSESE